MNNPKPWLRGIIHCHSRFSYDCVIPVAAYLRFAAEHSLDFIVLTDHDSIAGSALLREMAAKKAPGLEVPIAAEYSTDEGDVIAVFLRDELCTRNFRELVRAARGQGALLLLPHPFVGHSRPDRIAPECDLIEIYNSRTKPRENGKAAALAKNAGKPVYAASDAHFYSALSRVILEVENRGDLRQSLLGGEIRWGDPVDTPKWEIHLSQCIKAWKLKDARLAVRMIVAAPRAVFRSFVGPAQRPDQG